MSKLRRKAVGAIARTGARQGKVGLHVANVISGALLGEYVQLCDAGVDCDDPNHEHVDLQLRQR